LLHRPEPSALALPPDAREVLNLSWRHRNVPITGHPHATPAERDPTLADDARDIRPLETDEGLTWEAARGSRIRDDK
jgi:hypothetical protein